MTVLSLSYHSVPAFHLIILSILMVLSSYSVLCWKRKKPCFDCALYEFSVYLLVLGTHLYFVVQGQTSKESETYKKGMNVETMQIFHVYLKFNSEFWRSLSHF